MQALDLSGQQLSALRALMGMEPVPGSPLPHPDALVRLHQLVPCDDLGAVYSDLHGRISANVELLPHGAGQHTVVTEPIAQGHRDEDSPPFYLGVMHWRHHPAQAEHCGHGNRQGDALAIGFRNGSDAIVQYYFFRDSSLFTPDELARFELVVPLLGRLVRERPTTTLPASLTLAERRVLSHVAAGRSNAQVAETMCISVATVRKHLENAYRKLGVTNRMAAVARLRGCDGPGLDLRERVDRYAETLIPH